MFWYFPWVGFLPFRFDMDDVHLAIAVGLANELKVFCEASNKMYVFGAAGTPDWFKWEWGGGRVLVGLCDGCLFLADWSDEILPAVRVRWKCDLGHPELVDLLRARLGL